MSTGWLKKGGVGVSNARFFIIGRPAFTSEFKGIRALLISSSSLESSFIIACSGRGNLCIIDVR